MEEPGVVNGENVNDMDTRSSVKGILQNKAGQPVADAIVMIKESPFEFSDIASVTNSQGEFFLSGIVIPGRYVLQVQYNNASITREVNVSSPDALISVSM